MTFKSLDSKLKIINLFKFKGVRDYLHPSGELRLSYLKNDNITYDIQAKIYNGLWNIRSRIGKYTIFKRII